MKRDRDNTVAVSFQSCHKVADELSDDSRHNLTVLSWLPVAIKRPVGSKAIDITHVLCPVRVATQIGFVPSGPIFHNFAVLSPPVAKRSAVGWNATDKT